MVCADPPYGTTENEWDSIIPLDKLWAELRRVIKPRGAIVMTASQPFTTVLIASALDLFKYEWIWIKSRQGGHVHAKNKPMKKHENVLVFSPGTTVHEGQSKTRMHYYPQGVKKHEGVVLRRNPKGSSPTVHGARSTDKDKPDIIQAKFTNYPGSTLNFDNEPNPEHPTQKPVDLMAYLIRSYTLPMDTVLDFCMGSGTTGVAAFDTNRKFIGVEQNADYFNIARGRIRAAAGVFGKADIESFTDANLPKKRVARVR
jgi:site-specific DNA-methyltransferase (adenine-specific)